MASSYWKCDKLNITPKSGSYYVSPSQHEMLVQTILNQMWIKYSTKERTFELDVMFIALVCVCVHMWPCVVCVCVCVCMCGCVCVCMHACMYVYLHPYTNIFNITDSSVVAITAHK